MQCPQCQHENPEHAKFCPECGTRFQVTCAQCSTELPPAAKFCLECGHPVGGWPLAIVGRPTTPFPAPQTYTPQHLAERIISSRSALEGERKQVTVLFADLKGSMELLADRDPEEARQILDPVLERMMEAVHRYEGTVNQMMGDGIMAIFGAPLAREDHAVRACYAALHMQESVHQYADEVWRTDGLPIQIRVGLNSGEVVVRSIGNDLHMDYSAIGHVTHLAARMEQAATPGSILITPDTVRLIAGYARVKSLGPIPIKGLSKPLEVYEVIAAEPTPSRFRATAAGGLVRLVGREAELNQLRQALERARAGHGQAVALVADPGVGKSRLAWEFVRSPQARGWRVLAGNCVSYDQVTPYLPISELLRSYCGVEARDAPSRVRQKLLGKILDLDEAFRPSLPAFLALLDLPVDDPRWESLDSRQRRQLTLRACTQLLLRESQVRPLVLVLEDLHWVDAATEALLASLVESLPTAPLLLLVTYRPEYGHSRASQPGYAEIHLNPLSPERADELARGLIGDDARLQPLRRLLIERTEGNPFFLEESVRALRETGVLAGDAGQYRLAQPPDQVRVPATVQAVIAARIDRLAPEDKHLLQTAAVIGKDVPFPLLQTIAGQPERELREQLARLQATALLQEQTRFPELEYTFKHALTHEVAYGSLLQPRRRALHARVVEAVERRYPERLREQAEQLAHHAVCGEVWEKAATYHHQAGTKAFERSAHREAALHCERALAALQHLPASWHTRAQAIDVRFDLRNTLLALGELVQISEHLREAEALADEIGDQRRLGWASIHMSGCFWWLGEHDHALASGQRAYAIAEALGDHAFQLVANLYLGEAYHALGDCSRAMALYRRTLEALDDHLLHERLGVPIILSVFARVWLVTCLAERGEFAEGRAYGEEAVRIAEAGDHLFSALVAYWGIGNLCLSRGDLDGAASWLGRSLEICQTWQVPLWFPWVASALGYASLLSQRTGEGVVLFEQAVEQAARLRVMHDQALRCARLSEAYLLVGRPAEAMRHAERALDLSRQHKEPGNEAWALRLFGEIAAHAEPPAAHQAERYYQQARALAEELEMRPLAAHCHLGLGVLYQKVGRDAEAQAELTTTAQRYRALEMTVWAEKAETALAGARTA
jgi:class 3 adenylate cyclase/tetratricopeptide (TPR) repeat protein